MEKNNQFIFEPNGKSEFQLYPNTWKKLSVYKWFFGHNEPKNKIKNNPLRSLIPPILKLSWLSSSLSLFTLFLWERADTIITRGCQFVLFMQITTFSTCKHKPNLQVKAKKTVCITPKSLLFSIFFFDSDSF